MRVLLSALSCEPDRGSEPEVGFRALLAAAGEHEVWAITLTQSVERVLDAIRGDPRASRIHLEGIDFGVPEARINLVSAPEFHWHYDRWQRALSIRALELDRAVDFDVIHHVTLANYWARAGVAVVPKPLVWGPVGGGVNPPLVLLPALGPWGVVQSAARAIGRPLMASRPSMRRTRRDAEVTLAQNRATGRQLKGRHVSVLSNAVAVELDGVQPSMERDAHVLFVGRLLAWKAPMLALQAFRHVQDPNAVLVFCGVGPEQPRLERAMRRWGLSERVRFGGWLPRNHLLAKVARAGVLLHPALHEEAGLCVAEALSLGTPVVSLDHGGPAELVRQWPESPSILLPPHKEAAIARSLAEAIDGFLADPPPTLSRPRPPELSFQDELLSAYESAASKFGARDASSIGRQVDAPKLTGPWISLPNRSRTRWILPKTPRSATRAGLFVFHPVTFRGRMGWEIGKLLAGLGILGLFPASEPPEGLCEALFPFLPPRASVAVARTNHPRRYVALAVNDQGKRVVVAKVARDQAGRAKLRQEREQMETWAPFLPKPVTAPNVLAYDDGILVLKAVRWQPRHLPWRLSEDVAHALGGFFKRSMRGPSEMIGAAHGDCTPWNLLLSQDGEWTLVDWEDARSEAPPFFDVFHYLVQSNQELLVPRRTAIVDGLSGKGWIGGVIGAYAEGAGIPAETAGKFFEQYLKDSSSSLGPLAPRRGFQVRRDLARRVVMSGAHHQ
jgi:glycosyltransferase involved in cell wall biosynthesis